VVDAEGVGAAGAGLSGAGVEAEEAAEHRGAARGPVGSSNLPVPRSLLTNSLAC
jgi:hypothetical protein